MRATVLLLATASAALFAAPQAQAQTFTGPRAEANAGYDVTKYDDGVASTPDSLEGVRVGGVLGYDLPLGETFTIGAEAGIGFVVDGDAQATAGATTVRVTSDYDFDASLRLGAKVTPSTLLFVKGGYAISQYRATTKVVGTTGTTTTEVKDDADGYRLGAGVEQAFGEHIYAKAEYRLTDYGDDVVRHQALIGLGYRF